LVIEYAASHRSQGARESEVAGFEPSGVEQLTFLNPNLIHVKEILAKVRIAEDARVNVGGNYPGWFALMHAHSCL
jgi:hypothetical protein